METTIIQKTLDLDSYSITTLRQLVIDVVPKSLEQVAECIIYYSMYKYEKFVSWSTALTIARATFK